MSRARISLLPLVVALACGPAAAQLNRGLPPDIEGVGVDQRLDEVVPLDLRFVDEDGQSVRLGDYFQEGTPVLLNLVYYECPMLCTLVLNGVVDLLREITWVPGDEFRIVTVSIDPQDKPAMARKKKQNMIGSYGKPQAAAGWHFLTGAQPEIAALADAVGFRYRFIEDSGEYAHPAALMVVTPEGRISRYLLGLHHDPRTTRLSLVEASEGNVGSLVDRFILTCYSYDDDSGLYTPVAMRLMRLGGALTALVLGAVLLTYWRRERKRQER